MKVSTTASLVAVLPFAVVAMANRADTGKIPSQERPEKSTEEIMRRLEEVNSYDEYDLTKYGGDGSYNYDYVERSGGCSADYTDVTCYGGTVMISTSCDDATCSSCGLTIDHTAFTGGQYTCDETYFYVNSQLGGDLPGCFCDDNGGSYFNGGEDEEEVNSYAYDVVDYGGSYSYDGGMIDYGGLYSYDGGMIDYGGLYS